MAEEFDVIVVGGGNAAFCAALSAQEQGARVVMLERAPEEECGGNTRFTAGNIRFAYRGVTISRRSCRTSPMTRSPSPIRHLYRGPVLRRHVPRHPEPY
jgi:glycine/D-amino acid oxidase-like deaminating enzyme